MPLIAIPPAADRRGPTASLICVPSPVDTRLQRQVKNPCNDRCIPSPRSGSAPGLSGRLSRAAAQQAPVPSAPVPRAAACPYQKLDRPSPKYGHAAPFGSTGSVALEGTVFRIGKEFSERNLPPSVGPSNFGPSACGAANVGNKNLDTPSADRAQCCARPDRRGAAPQAAARRRDRRQFGDARIGGPR